MLIKRYSNRKLYDTRHRCYVTLDEVAALLDEEEDVQIIDHETGSDLTAQVLAQIVHEQQKKATRISDNSNLGCLPQEFLTRLSHLRLEPHISRSFRAFYNPETFFSDEFERRLKVLLAAGRIPRDEATNLRELFLDSAFCYAALAEEEEMTDFVPLEQIYALQMQLDALEEELKRLQMLG